MNLSHKSVALIVALATTGAACSSGSGESVSGESVSDDQAAAADVDTSNDSDDSSDDSPSDAETLRAEIFDVGEVNLGGFIVDSISESQSDVRFRNVGDCTGDNYAFGVFVDVDFGYNEEFDEDMGTTKYIITGTTEPGTADGSTRGDVPVTVLVQSLGDLVNSDDDKNIEGPGTMTIGEPIVMNEEPFFRGTPYVITATLDVDGQPLEVSVVDTIELVCN